jgi:hypothetical protein
MREVAACCTSGEATSQVNLPCKDGLIYRCRVPCPKLKDHCLLVISLHAGFSQNLGSYKRPGLIGLPEEGFRVRPRANAPLTIKQKPTCNPMPGAFITRP